MSAEAAARPKQWVMDRIVSTLWFEVPGLPQSQGSERAFSRGGKSWMTHDNPRLLSWRRDAILAIREAVKAYDYPVPITGPVAVWASFDFPRPAAHFGTGRNAGQLRASAPKHKTSKPDVSKLMRALEDALVGAGLIRDDAQIVEGCQSKGWSATGVPGTSVSVNLLRSGDSG